MQDDRNLFSQVLKAAAAWRINSGNMMEFGSGLFLVLSNWRTLENSSGVKSPEILSPAGVWIFQSSETSLAMSLAGSWSFTLYTLFFTSCDAIQWAEIGQGRREFLDLPVSLLMVFHVSLLVCVKSMVFTSSDQRSLRFSSNRASRAEVAILVASSYGAQRKVS